MPPRPHPIYFGPDSRPLFGMLHPPGASTPKATGIVLCNPIGYEAISTHRTFRHFAEAAAQLGYPVLRFDYDGTGNSSGHELDVDRLDAWLDSIRAAIDVLKRQANVDHVCLLGLRLGATLACVAACGRDDVVAMIAFAPVVNVRTYLREVRALAMTRPLVPPPDPTPNDPSMQEAAGFPTTEETRTALGKLDLLQLPAPAREVLICERDDLPGNDAWQKSLSAKGTNVATLPLSGYASLMLDAHSSVVPAATISASLAWLESLSASNPSSRVHGVAGTETTATPASISVTPRSGDARVIETPLVVGADKLFAVLTEPDTTSPPTNRRPVLLLLNSGTIHNIGPHRLYVNLARECAAAGTTVMRLDLSGVGESPPRPGRPENVPYAPAANDDVRQALQFLRSKFPDSEFHLAGVCSGAYHSLKVAVEERRLRSVIVINPLTFFWKEGMSLEASDFKVTAEATRYRKTALELSAWLKLLRGQVNIGAAVRVLMRRVLSVAKNGLRELARSLRIPLQDDLASDLRQVARKKTDIYFVFAASDPGLSMLREQGGRRVAILERRGALRISVVNGADHTFTAKWTRDHLIGLLRTHLDRFSNAG